MCVCVRQVSSLWQVVTSNTLNTWTKVHSTGQDGGQFSLHQRPDAGRQAVSSRSWPQNTAEQPLSRSVSLICVLEGTRSGNLLVLWGNHQWAQHWPGPVSVCQSIKFSVWLCVCNFVAIKDIAVRHVSESSKKSRSQTHTHTQGLRTNLHNKLEGQSDNRTRSCSQLDNKSLYSFFYRF